MQFDSARTRLLAASDDEEVVQGLLLRAADYSVMEQGGPPDEAAAVRFFTECPPGRDVSGNRKLGSFGEDGRLVAIADLALGYPGTRDSYLGLLLLEPASRSRGFGLSFLAHLFDVAREAGAHRMLLAVLDENVRARAFWERAGFVAIATQPSVRLGQKTHTVHRMARGI